MHQLRALVQLVNIVARLPSLSLSTSDFFVDVNAELRVDPVEHARQERSTWEGLRPRKA